MSESFENIKNNLKNNTQTWLVTGVAGFIGSHLLEFLLTHNQKVVGVDNYLNGFEDNLAQVKDVVGDELWKNFTFIEGDLRQDSIIKKACEGVRYILHQSGIGSSQYSLKEPLLTYEHNMTVSAKLFHQAYNNRIKRVVYASCSSVYGDSIQKVKRETVKGVPITPLGVSKQAIEMLAQNYAYAYGLKSVGLRYFNVFGPRQDPDGEFAAVIPKWITAMIKNNPVMIYGDPDSTRDYCYIDNAVQANILAALRPTHGEKHRIFNIGSGLRISLGQLCYYLKDLLLPDYPHLKQFKPVEDDKRKFDIKHIVADVSQSNAMLGYDPVVLVNEGIERSVDWYKDNA